MSTEKEKLIKSIRIQLSKNPGITAEEVAKKIKASVHTVRQYAWKEGIKFEGHIYKRKVKKLMNDRMEAIENLVQKDPFMSSKDIAQSVTMTQGRVLVLLKQMGYEKKWERRNGDGNKRTSTQ